MLKLQGFSSCCGFVASQSIYLYQVRLLFCTNPKPLNPKPYINYPHFRQKQGASLQKAPSLVRDRRLALLQRIPRTLRSDKTGTISIGTGPRSLRNRARAQTAHERAPRPKAILRSRCIPCMHKASCSGDSVLVKYTNCTYMKHPERGMMGSELLFGFVAALKLQSSEPKPKTVFLTVGRCRQA